MLFDFHEKRMGTSKQILELSSFVFENRFDINHINLLMSSFSRCLVTTFVDMLFRLVASLNTAIAIYVVSLHKF